MRSFDSIYQQAIKNKGSKKAIEDNLPEVSSKRRLVSLGDDRYLSEISRRVFRAGLKHSLVDAKWPAFEEAFYRFAPIRCAMMSDDELDAHMKNKTIIRHYGKIKTVRDNAVFVKDIAEEHGSFGRFISRWPETDIIGLWQLLKKRGAHLGGNSGPAFLRMVGKDTFRLTDDVVSILVNDNIVTKMPTSMRDLKLVQDAFNQWQQQSGRPLCEISRIVSFAAG